MLLKCFIAFSYSIFDVCFVLKEREISYNSAWRHLAQESFFPQQQYIFLTLWSKGQFNVEYDYERLMIWFFCCLLLFLSITFDFNFTSLMLERSASIFFYVLKEKFNIKNIWNASKYTTTGTTTCCSRVC